MSQDSSTDTDDEFIARNTAPQQTLMDVAPQDNHALGKFLTRVFNDVQIRQHATDGFVDATAMTKAKGAELRNYNKGKRANLCVTLLKKKLNIEVVRVERNASGHHVSWFHPLLALDLAQYLDYEFWYQMTVWCSRYTMRCLNGDRTLLKEITDQADLREDTLTLTTATIIPTKLSDNYNNLQVHESMAKQHVATVLQQKRLRELDPKITENSNTKRPKRELDKLTAELTAVGVDKDTDTRSFTSTLRREDKEVIVESKWDQIALVADFIFANEKLDTFSVATIYFIRVIDTDKVKVGYSGTMNSRVSTMQTSNPDELNVEFTFMTPKYLEYEAKIHLYLEAQHIRGEWFALPVGTDYFAIVRAACDI